MTLCEFRAAMFMGAMVSVVTKPYNLVQDDLHVLAAEALQEYETLTTLASVAGVCIVHQKVQI